MERKQKARNAHQGFTILDTVLSLFVVGTIVLLFSSLITARDANRRVLFRTQAAALADEQINTLKRLGFTNLNDQTDGSFYDILYNAGQWSVGTTGLPLSAPHTLELAANTNISGAASGRMLFPAGSYNNGTISAGFKIASDSPGGSAVGFLFRMQNIDNGYRLRIATTGTDLDGGAADGHNVVLEKIVDGTASILLARSSSLAVTADTWYTIQLDLAATAPTIKAYINGNQQDLNDVADITFLEGSVALLGWSGVHAFVDDAQTITTGTDTWGFDTNTELPAAWIRLGLNDLPNATPNAFDDNGKLTIAPYPNVNAQNLKQATIRVEWQNGGTTQNYTSTVLIGKSEIGL